MSVSTLCKGSEKAAGARQVGAAPSPASAPSAGAAQRLCSWSEAEAVGAHSLRQSPSSSLGRLNSLKLSEV